MKVNALQTLASDVLKAGLTSTRKPDNAKPDFTQELTRVGRNQKPDTSASRQIPDKTEDDARAKPRSSEDESVKAKSSSKDRKSDDRVDSQDQSEESGYEESAAQAVDESDSDGAASPAIELSIQPLNARVEIFHFSVEEAPDSAAVASSSGNALIDAATDLAGGFSALEGHSEEQGAAEKAVGLRTGPALGQFSQPAATATADASNPAALRPVDLTSPSIGPVATLTADPTLVNPAAVATPDQPGFSIGDASSTAALSGTLSDQEFDQLPPEPVARPIEKSAAKLTQPTPIETTPTLEPEQVLRNLKAHVQTDIEVQSVKKKSGVTPKPGAAEPSSAARVSDTAVKNPLAALTGDQVIKSLESQAHFDAPARAASESDNVDKASAQAAASSRAASAQAAAFPGLDAISVSAALADDALLTSPVKPQAIISPNGLSMISSDAPASVPVAATGAAATQNSEPGGLQTANAQFSTQVEAEMDGAELAQQAMRGIRGVVNQRGGAIKLQLTPPELGELRIQVKMENGVVRATFLASNETARRLLEQQSGTLRTALEAHGLRVENIQVQLQPPNGSQSGFLQDWQQSASDGQSRGSFERNPSEQGASGGHNPSDQEGPARQFDRELLDVTV